MNKISNEPVTSCCRRTILYPGRLGTSGYRPSTSEAAISWDNMSKSFQAFINCQLTYFRKKQTTQSLPSTPKQVT